VKAKPYDRRTLLKVRFHFGFRCLCHNCDPIGAQREMRDWLEAELKRTLERKTKAAKR
jgi:disulfide oxidoreductase YuzD